MYEDNGVRIHGFGFFMEYFWNVIFGDVKPLSFVPSGSWKYISRYTYQEDNNIYTELKNNENIWMKSIIPCQHEANWEQYVKYI